MSVLSANTLFHFTEKEALFGILKNGFRPSYCSEFGPEHIDDYLKEMFIPMVCFCDLPLSRLEKHIKGYQWDYNGVSQNSKKYGSYGLGMSKDWGKRYRLNPVMYINPESLVFESTIDYINGLISLYYEYEERWKNDPTDPHIKRFWSEPLTRGFGIGTPPMPHNFKVFDQLQIVLSNAISTLSFYKTYQNKKTGQVYYDEREWRSVVPYSRRYYGDVPILIKSPDNEWMPMIGHIEGTKYDLEIFKQRIINNYMLGFKTNEIKYIIVRSEADINEVIDELKKEPTPYKEHDINYLITRIITCDQIHEDF